MEVLEWLNNGKPKVFKSPTEGNYIIRLMNVSLSPNDTLGRMLHTFNSTAYEIAEYNFQNLYNLNLINLPTYSGLNVKVGQINCSNIIDTFDDEDFGIKYPHIINKDELGKLYPNYSTFMNIMYDCIGFNVKIYNANITEALPGTVIRVLFEDGSHKDITIGITGSYYF
jgi:hypothetical protein